MELIFSKKFKKQAQKLVQNKPNLKARINDCLRDFARAGKQSQYYRRPLRHNWAGFDELQVGGDIRIIVRIRVVEGRAVLLQIGTHSQLGL